MPELSSHTPQPDRRRTIVLALALVALIAVAYAPVRHCGFIWDDDDYVVENETLQSAAGLRDIWLDVEATPQYYPLVHTSFWIEYRLWELNPTGYHLTNVALHALAAMLLWRVLHALGLPAAWAIAAVFAVHPVHVESVAWITERKNVLSAVFYLAAGAAYLRFAMPETTDRRRWRWYVLAFALFLAALLSKTITCSLPAAILLVLWWKRRPIRSGTVLALVPFFATGLALGLVTAGLEEAHVGATGEEWSLSFLQRILVAGNALCFYAGKLIWPSSLTFIYPRWTIDPSNWRLWLGPIAVVAVVAALALNVRRTGRGPLTAVLLFSGTLFPALGFFDIYPMRYSFVADHFQYLASIGVLALAVCAARRLLGEGNAAARRATVLGLVLVLALLGTATWQQTHIYRDLESLWTDTLAKNPTAWLAHNNLGTVLQEKGELDAAADHYRRALELKPDYPLAHHNLGNLHRLGGDLREAVRCYRRAIRYKPDYAGALNNLATALKSMGRVADAAEHLRQAVKTNPQFVPARINLANLYRDEGRFAEAMDQYRAALTVAPQSAVIHHEAGMSCLFANDEAAAIEHLRKAVELDPRAPLPQTAIARILSASTDEQTRDPAAAELLARTASELSNQANPFIEDTLAIALAANGKFKEAVESAQRARALAESARDRAFAAEIAARIRLYEAGQSYQGQ